jgi:glyoxylase-like metal-dependent hydrolase (beta-lactamase superfamily II)
MKFYQKIIYENACNNACKATNIYYFCANVRIMWQYRILTTGFFHADGGAMFGAIPKRAWSRKYPADDRNSCILAMNCLLLWNESRVVVIDTGVGTKSLGTLAYYEFFDRKNIADLVREAGFEPEQVTDVILSHLHFDHCGGCTYPDADGKLQVTFPQAIHHISKAQWANLLAPNDLEKDSYRVSDILPITEHGFLKLVIDAETELYPGLHLSSYDGHTPGQLVASFVSGNKQIIFAGDVVPTHAHLSDEWISAYDTHPLDSLAAKRRLKAGMEERPSRVIYYHEVAQIQGFKETD